MAAESFKAVVLNLFWFAATFFSFFNNLEAPPKCNLLKIPIKSGNWRHSQELSAAPWLRTTAVRSTVSTVWHFSASYLMHCCSGVNFNNILHAGFLYGSKLSSFSLITFGFAIFWRQNISKKVERKLLMKLTPILLHFTCIDVGLDCSASSQSAVNCKSLQEKHEKIFLPKVHSVNIEMIHLLMSSQILCFRIYHWLYLPLALFLSL